MRAVQRRGDGTGDLDAVRAGDADDRAVAEPGRGVHGELDGAVVRVADVVPGGGTGQRRRFPGGVQRLAAAQLRGQPPEQRQLRLSRQRVPERDVQRAERNGDGAGDAADDAGGPEPAAVDPQPEHDGHVHAELGERGRDELRGAGTDRERVDGPSALAGGHEPGVHGAPERDVPVRKTGEKPGS